MAGRAREHTAVSTSEIARIKTATLASESNLKRLIDLPGGRMDRGHRHRILTRLVLDMDSWVSESYGQQQGFASNGHFRCACCHPLFIFNQFGDLERAMLRRGNHHIIKFWRRVLLPVIARYRDLKVPKLLRGDAVFATPKLKNLLEGEGYSCVIRLKANAVLERNLIPLLRQPVGHSPLKKPKVCFQSFRYRAKS